MPAPEFWTRTGPCARLLSPAAHIYGLFRQLHNGLVRPANAPVPVVCVGNLTVGGSGKTPVALSIAEYLKFRGRNVPISDRALPRPPQRAG